MKSGTADTVHFNPNSTCAAYTSATFRKGVPLETIMAVTGWSSEDLTEDNNYGQLPLLSYNKHVVLYSRLYQWDDYYFSQLQMFTAKSKCFL